MAVSAGLALVVAFAGRTRLPAPLAFALLALCGAGIGWGAGGIERIGVSADLPAQGRQWLIATILLAILTPLHARVVLGPFGRRA